MFVDGRLASARRKAATWIHGDKPDYWYQRPDDRMQLLASVAASCTVRHARLQTTYALKLCSSRSWRHQRTPLYMFRHVATHMEEDCCT